MIDMFKYGAKWCAGCKSAEQLLRPFHEQGLINIIDIDVETSAEEARKYGIKTLPTIIVDDIYYEGLGGVQQLVRQIKEEYADKNTTTD